MKPADILISTMPDDAAAVPPGKIRVSDFLELVDLLVEDITRSMMAAVDDAGATPEQVETVEAALDRAEDKAAAIIDAALAPKPDA